MNNRFISCNPYWKFDKKSLAYTKNIIIYDTSYIIFDTIYSVVKNKDDISAKNIDSLINRFRKHFNRRIFRSLAKHNVNMRNAYFVRDCPRDKIWRKKQKNVYKSKKNKSYCPLMSKFFDYIYNIFLPTLVKRHNCHVIQIDEAEADEVIALLVKKLTNKNIVIICKDKDLFQLKKKYKFLQFYTFKGYSLNKDALKWCRIISFNNNQLIKKINNKNFINLDKIPKLLVDRFEKVLSI